MKRYEKTLTELQKIGDAILDKYNSSNPFYEVDIEYIIESGFGIKIEPVALKAEFKIEAFPSLAKNTIYVDIGSLDDERQERRYRFTLAEELAHIILHADIYKEVSTFEDYFKAERSIPDDLYRRLDNNAKELAGIILMPKHPFINRAIEIRDELCRLKGQDKQNLTDIEKDITRNRIVKILMDDFNVNQEPCEIRLERIERGMQSFLFEMKLDSRYLKKGES